MILSQYKWQAIMFSELRGQVVLVANVASMCGFTTDGYASI